MKGILNFLLKTFVGKLVLANILNLFKAWLLRQTTKTPQRRPQFVHELEDLLMRSSVDDFIKAKDDKEEKENLEILASHMVDKSKDQNPKYNNAT